MGTSVDLRLHLTDQLKIQVFAMKFLILASLFVLSVVAEPEAEAEPQHFTAGLVQHPNGAITPDDTDSVKAVKALHMDAKFGAHSYNFAKGFYNMPHMYQHGHMPQVYQNDYMPHQVYQNDYMPQIYNFHPGMPSTYTTNPFHHVYQPQVFGSLHRSPAVHGLGKRDAEADADAEAESHYYHSYSRPSAYFPSRYRFPSFNRFAGYQPQPFFQPKDASTYMNNAMPLRQALESLKIQRPVAFRTNYQSYDPYPSRTYNLMRQSGVQNQVAHTSFNGFNRF